MVNIFGDRGKKGTRGERGAMGPTGRQGPRGERGPEGEAGSFDDLCSWMPNSVLKQLQEEEEMCYSLTSESDVKREEGEIVEWKCRNKKHDSIKADIASKDLIEVSGGYAIGFNRNRYKEEEMLMFQCLTGYSGYLCITFRVSGEEEQTLMTNFQEGDRFHQFHEISATRDEIRIWGCKNKQPTFTSIKHDCRGWTTLFIEYKVSPSELKGTYNIDGTQGEFTFDRPYVCRSGTFIGGRSDGTKFLTGAIHAIERYSMESKQDLPYILKDLIIKGQKIGDEEHYVKRRKITM